jgi:hypothetical protein
MSDVNAPADRSGHSHYQGQFRFDPIRDCGGSGRLDVTQGGVGLASGLSGAFLYCFALPTLARPLPAVRFAGLAFFFPIGLWGWCGVFNARRKASWLVC